MLKKAESSKFKPRIAKYCDHLDGPPQIEYFYSGDSCRKAGYYPEDEFIIEAYNGHLKMCQEFIEQGIDVNIVHYKTKETALHVAARNCNPELCKLLLEHGAKVNLPSRDNETPLMVATETASAREAVEDLKNALRTCEILIQHGADVNITGGPAGTLTLKYYSGNKNPILTELLEKHGLLHKGCFVEEKSSICLPLPQKYSDPQIDVQINGDDSGNNDWWCTIL